MKRIDWQLHVLEGKTYSQPQPNFPCEKNYFVIFKTSEAKKNSYECIPALFFLKDITLCELNP